MLFCIVFCFALFFIYGILSCNRGAEKLLFFQSRKNYDSRTGIITILDREKVRGNKTEKNKTE